MGSWGEPPGPAPGPRYCPDSTDPDDLVESCLALMQGSPVTPEGQGALLAEVTALAAVAQALYAQRADARPVWTAATFGIKEDIPALNAELEALRGVVRKLKGAGKVALARHTSESMYLQHVQQGTVMADRLTEPEAAAWDAL